MKNYPLLPLNHRKQWMSWRKTYLNEINNNIHALWDYANYFLPDYCEYELEVDPITHSVEGTQLPFNGYFRAHDSNINIYLDNQDQHRILKQGYLLVSKARNENGLTDFSKDINNYFIQPFGYGSFYLFSYHNGQLIGTYNTYAEETYGLNYMFSLFTKYPRFVLRNQGLPNGLLWAIASYNQAPNIYNASGTLWTDIDVLKPMVFHFSRDSDYGEEVIIDSYSYNSIRVDDFNIAVYNEVVLEKGDTNAWNGIDMRLI